MLLAEADTINDKKSVERCLDKSLMLLVLQQLGRRSHWVLPQGPRLDGESMRQVWWMCGSDSECG